MLVKIIVQLIVRDCVSLDAPTIAMDVPDYVLVAQVIVVPLQVLVVIVVVTAMDVQVVMAVVKAKIMEFRRFSYGKQTY